MATIVSLRYKDSECQLAVSNPDSKLLVGDLINEAISGLTSVLNKEELLAAILHLRNNYLFYMNSSLNKLISETARTGDVAICDYLNDTLLIRLKGPEIDSN